MGINRLMGVVSFFVRPQSPFLRPGQCAAEACVAGFDCSSDRRWFRHERDHATDGQEQAVRLALETGCETLKNALPERERIGMRGVKSLILDSYP
jgi:hypothetical protein